MIRKYAEKLGSNMVLNLGCLFFLFMMNKSFYFYEIDETLFILSFQPVLNRSNRTFLDSYLA